MRLEQNWMFVDREEEAGGGGPKYRLFVDFVNE